MLDTTNSRHAHIAERLRSNTIGWLVTVRADGRPHIVAVWFLWDEGSDSILVFSKPEQQKIININHNPQVSLALDDSRDGSDPIVIEGSAEILDDPGVNASISAYVEKYGERMRGIGFNPPEKMAQVYSQGIRITLRRVM